MPQLTLNKYAKFEYDLGDRFEAGIRLSGPEVKSAKRGHVMLRGSYVSIRPDGAWLMNAYIAPYKPAASVQQGYNPYRDRRLLLNRTELGQLAGTSAAAGLTVVPVSFYTKGGFVKVELAVAKGKRAVDKRDQLRKRDAERKIQRALRTKT